MKTPLLVIAGLLLSAYSFGQKPPAKKTAPKPVMAVPVAVPDTIDPPEEPEEPEIAEDKSDEEKQKEAAEKRMDSIIKRLEKTDNINLGAFLLSKKNRDKIVAHKPESEKIEGLEIEKATLIIDGGRICKITVLMKDKEGCFKNTGPISVTVYDKCRDERLYYYGTEAELRGFYIKIGDFLDYQNYTNRISYPVDEKITLNADTLIHVSKLSKSPIDFFDVRSYTDAKGLSGEANGLAQTEVNVRFIGNTRNVLNTPVTFLPSVSMNLSLSKFDSDFDTLQMTSLTDRTDNDLLRMMQYSNLGFRVEVDLIRYSRVHDGFLTLGHQMYTTRIADTSGNAARVFTPSFYLTLGGTLFSGPVIKCNYKLPFMVSYLNDQPFENYAPKTNFTIIPEIELIVDPIHSDETTATMKGATLFGRIKYFDMPNFQGNNFWQLQIGASIPLSEVLK